MRLGAKGFVTKNSSRDGMKGHPRGNERVNLHLPGGFEKNERIEMTFIMLSWFAVNLQTNFIFRQ